MGDASLPSSFQEELVNLKRLIESLETSSTESTTNDSKNSILNSILERVEGCFDDCENFVQESKRFKLLVNPFCETGRQSETYKANESLLYLSMP